MALRQYSYFETENKTFSEFHDYKMQESILAAQTLGVLYLK